MLVTHWGLSGPVILRLSAWGARELFRANYTGTIQRKDIIATGVSIRKCTILRLSDYIKGFAFIEDMDILYNCIIIIYSEYKLKVSA